MERETRKLLGAIPIDLRHKCVYLKDIPEPYRTQFAHDNQRSAMAIRFVNGRPEPSAYAWDWRNWLEYRCRAPEWTPRISTGAVKTMDEAALEEWRSRVEKGLANRRKAQ